LYSNNNGPAATAKIAVAAAGKIDEHQFSGRHGGRDDTPMHQWRQGRAPDEWADKDQLLQNG
jgi:hypothetical protein